MFDGWRHARQRAWFERREARTRRDDEEILEAARRHELRSEIVYMTARVLHRLPDHEPPGAVLIRVKCRRPVVGTRIDLVPAWLLHTAIGPKRSASAARQFWLTSTGELAVRHLRETAIHDLHEDFVGDHLPGILEGLQRLHEQLKAFDSRSAVTSAGGDVRHDARR